MEPVEIIYKPKYEIKEKTWATNGMRGKREKNIVNSLYLEADLLYKHNLNLQEKYKLIKEKKYVIENIDSNIIAQQPKMMPYIPKMKEVLCKILEIETDRLSIKAKTNEKMDAVGQELAIEAQAVVLMKRV